MKTNMLQTELCGITLDNPVMAASGTFGYGREFAELYDINCLGSFSFKGTTLEPRFGNPTPRIAECEAGLINSIGLQNPGVEKVIEEELPHLATIFDKKVMANIGGFSVEEYAQVAQRLDCCDQIGWIEVNISCPNVRHGGIAFGTDPDAAASVIRAVKDGIATAEQVIEMMLAGACAVQIGAANLVDPYVCRNVIRDLPEVMRKYGIAELKDIIGGAHNG